MKVRRTKTAAAMGILMCIAFAYSAFGYPSVYPTGVTIYKPDKCWNGYTVYAGGILIDMNGKVLKDWKLSQMGKVLPGGYVMGDIRYDGPRIERGRELVQKDWDGNIVWQFNKTTKIKIGDKLIWTARQHHDFQREGNPVGYYAPGMEPLALGGKTLVLAAREVKKPQIAPTTIAGDCLLEVDWDGNIVWEWQSTDHFDEIGFSEEAKNAIYRGSLLGISTAKADTGEAKKGIDDIFFDWIHSNCASYVGPNKWYAAGDKRFHPDNIVWDGRNTNTIFIIDKKTGKIVWKVGPDYTASAALRKLGPIIGQHHAHIIPKGLPGEGNMLVFDNGGRGGYGAPNPGSPRGVNNAIRDHSRVIEFNPVTLKVVWEYTAEKSGFGKQQMHRFYSPYISGAQRLLNGNTLICEGNDGRIFEVTPKFEIVWEYILPKGGSYRAYRVPYEWIPQLKKPVERAVIPPKLSEFRIEPQGKK